VSPLRGGEADKFGNRYEGRWTTRQLLYVLQGQVDSVTVEEAGEIGKGVEFTVRRPGKTEVHQVKRQHASANQWELFDLKANGVLAAAQDQVAKGRQFWFVSSVPIVVLDQLADAARRSSDLQSFVGHRLTSNPLRAGFDYLSGKAYSSAETAWRTLRGLEVLWPPERDLEDMNNALAGLLLEGAEPSLAAVGLGNLVPDNLGVPLNVEKLIELLEPFGLRPKPLSASPTISQRVRETLISWQESIGRELLQPTIVRSKSGDFADQLRNGLARLSFVVGVSGGGKSAVMYQTVAEIEADGWPILALRLDRIEPFSSTLELGQRRNLGTSPVTALAAAAQNAPSVLVIDQLDAVSLASGRMPDTFDAIADLLREAKAFPEMRVVLVCRKFDVDNDYRIRALASQEDVTSIEVGSLSDEQVDAAVRSMELPAESLTAKQRDLLRTPLHLVLLQTVADQPDALFFTTSRQLFDAYWDRKRRDCRQQRPQSPARFADVISVLAEAMSERQQLSVPRSALDQRDLLDDADVLASLGVLVSDGLRLAFFHEAFFDYAFARQWLNRRQTLVEFLRAGEQELFRRSQVRQILLHLRDGDPERYVSEVEAVLTDANIRFHIKDVVLAFLRALSDPTVAEWQMMMRLIAADLPFSGRLWLTMRTLPWFERLDTEDVITGWLASSEVADHRHALELMLGAVKERPDRMAELLAPHAGQAADYPAWLSWVTRFGSVPDSRALFDLVLAAVRGGDYRGIEHALWLAVHALGQRHPEWAAELLQAYLVDRPGSLDLDKAGHVAALRLTEHTALELASQSAEAAPEAFCELLLPYMLRVMQLTEVNTPQSPVNDRHFSQRYPVSHPVRRLDDVLLRAMAVALGKLVERDPQGGRQTLELLAADRHDSAQWLLYEGLQAAGERCADWAAALLLEGDHRLVSGYIENYVWTTRLVLQAITPYVSAESFAALERAVMAFGPSWELRQSTGWASFTLLSAMSDYRLSGAARRRLGELRRRFNTDQPPAPVGLQVAFIGPPIPPEAASHMTDEQWLTAIEKYDADTGDFETLRGGAHELSQVLKTETMADPERFAHLALRLTDRANPAYSDAILIALAEPDRPIAPALVFDVIRHIASLGHEDHQDWLGWPLRRYLDDDIPDDIIEIILGRALRATSPTGNSWPPSEDLDPYGGDIFNSGLNSARGQSAVVLGDLIMHDASGRRTALVAPALSQLAADPVVAVRACVAHVLTACLRYARTDAIAAFRQLIDTDDRLLSTLRVLDLMMYIAVGERQEIEPVIQRMLGSTHAQVRRAGGQLAAFAGLELGLAQLLTAARDSQDADTRNGAAFVCAHRLPHTKDARAAADALQQFVDDPDDVVRKTAAEVAGALRGQALLPFTTVLAKLIASPAFSDALPQLLITLQQAPDRIDGLVTLCATRFLNVHGADASNIQTAAAHQAPEIGRLVLRAYAQAADSVARVPALNLIDDLLFSGAYEFDRIIDEAER
jgi:hypothetical protein